MTNLTLYTSTASRGSYVQWMLEECGADYQTVALDLDKLKTPAYLAINPMGKVPALQDGDYVVTETLAILTHLAEKYPEKHLIPASGSPERGQYYRWLCFALHLEYAAIDRLRGIENNAEQQRMIGYGSFDSAFTTLKTHLQNREYIVGERFSALDLYYSGLLLWLTEHMQTLAPDPVFTAYMQRHLARPAAARAQEKEAALTVRDL